MRENYPRQAKSISFFSVSVKDVVGLEQQLKFAGQIASAMLYLEESKYSVTSCTVSL